MDPAFRSLQREIDAIKWYHEFDFGNGLRAVPATPNAHLYRSLWKYIETRLDMIDFEGKTVLDIGCWDGYWSVYAERRGAKRVLATDDLTQNPLQATGLQLVKRLLKSNIEINQSLSVYELSKLGEKFDIILCLGVYYHLMDPFAAFAEIRHCLRKDSFAVFEGDVTHGLRPDCSYWDPRDSSTTSVFIPAPFALKQMLGAAYLGVVDQSFWNPAPAPDPVKLTLGFHKKIAGLQDPAKLGPVEYMNRSVTIAKPFVAENPLHHYKPPFGLDRYDPRFDRAPVREDVFVE